MTDSPSTSGGTVPLTKSKLSELALDAAIELDRAARSKVVIEAPGIALFFDSLRQQLDQDHKRVFKDQTLVPVYALALSRSEGESFVPRENLSALLQKVLEKHDSVGSTAGSSTDGQIAFLRDFCLAVHEALIANLMGSRTNATQDDARVRYH